MTDHNNIEYTVESDLIQLPEQWRWKDADWDLFKNEMVRTTPIIKEGIITQKVCDELVTAFYSSINEALNSSVPKSKPRVVDNNNPWWTEELQNRRKKLNKLYKKKATGKSIHVAEQYRIYRNCLLYTSPSPRDRQKSRMPSSA